MRRRSSALKSASAVLVVGGGAIGSGAGISGNSGMAGIMESALARFFPPPDFERDFCRFTRARVIMADAVIPPIVTHYNPKSSLKA